MNELNRMVSLCKDLSKFFNGRSPTSVLEFTDGARVKRFRLPFWSFVLVVLILSIGGTTALCENWRTPYHPNPDTVIYFSGSFQWNEGTVVQPGPRLRPHVMKYLDILDHVNVDFGDNPESVILLMISGNTELKKVEIRVLEDTILVESPDLKSMEFALNRLAEMKKESEQESPDYGLIYIRCGVYRFENF